MRTATTKVRRETYETFRRICEARETTPYAVLRDFLLAFVENFGGGGEAQAPPSRSAATQTAVR